MTRLSEVGEAITGTLFNALVINGMYDSYERFLVQESFQPAKAFPQLRTRFHKEGSIWREDWTWSRCHASCGEKERSVKEWMLCVLSENHMARECKSTSDSGQSSTWISGLNEAIGPAAKMQKCFKCGQPAHFASESKQRRTGFFSVAPLQLQGRETTSMIMWCATGLSSLALRFGTKEQLGRTPTARCGNWGQRFRGSGYQGLPWGCEELHFSQSAVCAELQFELMWAQLWLEGQVSLSTQWLRISRLSRMGDS